MIKSLKVKLEKDELNSRENNQTGTEYLIKMGDKK